MILRPSAKPGPTEPVASMKRKDLFHILWALLYAAHSQSILTSDSSDPNREPGVHPIVVVKIPPAIPDSGEPLPNLCDAIDFGPNVMIFDPSMSNTFIQSQIDSVFQIQEANQFGSQRTIRSTPKLASTLQFSASERVPTLLPLRAV